jgi:nucleotide-binding universal stress UspA family protein
MSYKTILVHLNDKNRAEALLEPAVRLAKRYRSHLIGINVYPRVPAPPIRLPFATGVIGALAAAERIEAGEIAVIFSRMTRGQPFTTEWRAEKSPHLDLARVVIQHGLAADLIVAGQADLDWCHSAMFDFPERLALESGRPVLVVPHAGRYTEIGSNVVVAWKPRREAARAAFDALPLLEDARRVQVLHVRQRADDPPAPGENAIGAALSRHGIEWTARTSVAPDVGVGGEILSCVAAEAADLLVLGAYGHGRMRELVFGGVTIHVARHMNAPTLFSH